MKTASLQELQLQGICLEVTYIFKMGSTVSKSSQQDIVQSFKVTTVKGFRTEMIQCKTIMLFYLCLN